MTNFYQEKISADEKTSTIDSLKTFKATYKEILNIPSNISFGPEIEFDNADLDEVSKKIGTNPRYKDWIIKEDKSVLTIKEGRVIGGEIASKVLHDTKEDWKDLKKLLDELKKLKAKATNRTAFHIHVGGQIFELNLTYLKRFIKLWCLFEDIIFHFGFTSNIAREHIEIFAPSLNPIYYKLRNKNPNIVENLSTTKEFDFGKRRAVSFKNYRILSNEEIIGNTIEIRCFDGTLDSITAQSNIFVILKIMLYVKSTNYDEDLINYLFKNLTKQCLDDCNNCNLEKAIFFSKLVFENENDRLAFLKQYLKPADFILR